MSTKTKKGIERALRKRNSPKESIHNSEGMFRDLAEKSLAGIYLLQEGVIKYANPSFSEIFGYTVEEMTDKIGYRDTVFHEDWPLVEENIRKRISHEVQSLHYEFSGVRKSGEIINLDAYGSYTIYRGRPAVIGTMLDITKRKRAEELDAYEKKLLREKTIVLEQQLNRIEVYDRLVGDSKKMEKVRQLISIAAPSDIPVLIQGETGTGKELTARAIHDQSPRAGNPFVAINSSVLQETIFESEVFGYRKGAFTGAGDNKLGLLELANGGTLFVDEISDMAVNIQSKLLRVLETGTFVKLGDTKETKVNVRFVFATNRELGKEVEEGRFRKDLLYRVNAFVIHLPPLREKTEDIPVLADYFLKKFARGNNKKVLSDVSMALLVSYGWPGNVRELKNVLERAVLLSTDRQEIITSDFPEGLLTQEPGTIRHDGREPKKAKLELNQIEMEHIENVLNALGGNKTKAAQLLGITRATLYKKVRKRVTISEGDRPR